jgi:hypothetical protein
VRWAADEDVSERVIAARYLLSLFQVRPDPTGNIPLIAPLLDIPLPQDRASTVNPDGVAVPATCGADGMVVGEARG